MKKPNASFVIPVYNGQSFLAETIQSCIDQTQSRIEIIVVDDGSTDATSDILTHFQYTDERIRVIRMEKNGGRSNARNKGIESAQSDIILTLDADDLNISDRVEKTLKFFKKNPTIDIVYSNCHRIDVWSELLVFKYPDGRETIEFPATPFDYERVKTDLLTYIPCHSAMSYKKKVFDKVKYTDGDWSVHGIDDWRFQVDAFNAGFKFGQINRVLVQYRAIHKERDEARIKELKEAHLAMV